MKPPKVLMGILGMDQHEVGARAVSGFLRDAGMEVVYVGRFNLPPNIANMAIQEDVDVIGLSCHSWEYLYYVRELLDLLTSLDADIPVVIGGSVITDKDREEMLAQGVRGAFGPSASREEIIGKIREIAASVQARESVGNSAESAVRGVNPGR